MRIALLGFRSFHGVFPAKIGQLYTKGKMAFVVGLPMKYQIDEFDYTQQPNDDIWISPIISFKKGGFLQTTGHWLADFYIKKEGSVSSPVVPPPITHARVEWWEEKDFRGRKHIKFLNPMENNKCISLVHNDKMKSFKFYANAGATLRIYDHGDCHSSDDVGIAGIPEGANMVAVPKIGKRGEQEAIPAGAYKLHFRNGIVGKVSSIKHTGIY